MERGHEAVQSVTEQMNHVILGKRQEIREIMLAALAGGHILLEDMPGVGKTTLALAFARAVRLEFHRIQFTLFYLPAGRGEVRLSAGKRLLGQSACSTKKELQSWGFDYTILFGEESILQDSSPDFYVENQGRTV